MKVTQKIAVAYLRARLRILSVISPAKAARELFDFFSTPKIRTLKPLPDIFLEAAVLQSLFDGEHITGYQWNNGGNRKALIVHGYESAAVNFEMFVSVLIDKGYEVYAFDAPAHGRSEGKKFNVRDYQNFVLGIIEKYGPFDSFIAHSIGGLAVCMALADIPNNENYRVVLIAPLTESLSSAKQLFEFLRIRSDAVRKIFDQLITTIGQHPLKWYSLARTLPQLHSKILWIHDTDDIITPYEDVEKIDFKAYNNVTLKITSGLGHRRIYRDVEVGRTIASFL